MAVKNAAGKDLVELVLKPNWRQGQTGLLLTMPPTIGGVVMSVDHVDDLIGDLIQMRDAMEKLNPPKPEA